jgi:hypothetical protein
MADNPEPDYSAYQARSAWCIRHFGDEVNLWRSDMEDGKTTLAIMEFAPFESETVKRPFWTYVTNGMSQRQLPIPPGRKGKKQIRLELFAYAREQSEWLAPLLDVLANYPFVHSSPMGLGFTLLVSKSYRKLWGGYLVTRPSNEADDFSPMGFETGIAPDILQFAQVVGLTTEEMYFAAREGGMELAERLSAAGKPARLFLDVPPEGSLVEEGEST